MGPGRIGQKLGRDVLRAQLIAVGGVILALSVGAGPALAQPSGSSAGQVARWSGYWSGGSERVREVQRDLRSLRYRPGPVDGLFGPRTERAVVRFQSRERLRADGIVGSRTLRRLRGQTRDEHASRVVRRTRTAPPSSLRVTIPELPRAGRNGSGQPLDVVMVAFVGVLWLVTVFTGVGVRIVVERRWRARRRPAVGAVAAATGGPAGAAGSALGHRRAAVREGPVAPSSRDGGSR
jgi:Putative peptidoglycan binding domain